MIYFGAAKSINNYQGLKFVLCGGELAYKNVVTNLMIN